MRIYLVIGIFFDDQTRYADTFEADSPEEAQQFALDASGDTLTVAAVLVNAEKAEVVL